MEVPTVFDVFKPTSQLPCCHYSKRQFFLQITLFSLLVGREVKGSLTEEAAQLLKLWLSFSGETEDASTTVAERYKMKALPLKHRPCEERWAVLREGRTTLGQNTPECGEGPKGTAGEGQNNQ